MKVYSVRKHDVHQTLEVANSVHSVQKRDVHLSHAVASLVYRFQFFNGDLIPECLSLWSKLYFPNFKLGPTAHVILTNYPKDPINDAAITELFVTQGF